MPTPWIDTETQTLEWLYSRQLKIDEEWACIYPHAIRWWSGPIAQTIEIIDQEEGPGGCTGYWVSVRTDLLEDCAFNSDDLGKINSLLMCFASLAGPVYDQDSETLSLCSIVRVYELISPWVNPLLGMAAAMQLGEAYALNRALAEALGVRPAISSHPINGLRQERDEITYVTEALILPASGESSEWTKAEFRQSFDLHFKRRSDAVGSVGSGGMTVEFPFGDNTSLCQLVASQPHPRYGNGLLVLQTFPVRVGSESEGVRLAFELNAEEFSMNAHGHGLGSYAFRDGFLRFTAFYPNLAYREGILANLCVYCASRARHIALKMTGVDWTGARLHSRVSPLKRLLGWVRS